MRPSMLFLIILWASAGAFASSPTNPWNITQTSWEPRHEDAFGSFVARIGEAVEKRECGKVNTCLMSSANPYFGSDPQGLIYYADCADLPYFLRGYFAGLFSFLSDLT